MMKFWGLVVSLFMLVGIGQAVFAQEYGLGDIPLNPETYSRYLKIYPDQLKDGLPAAYDARDDGIVTSAKNQGVCGSCWAFASAGAMESHILKNGGPVYDLSEQQQVSCNVSMSGCCGGSSTAPQYWQTTGPINESCGPYGESSTSCPTERTVPCSDMDACEQLSYRVTNWHTVGATPSDFKASLYTYGPSYWRFSVYSDFYTYWNSATSGAVYTNAGGTREGGHAVLLIGWDDAKQAYLCKNSWGASGGPNGDGTFWIAYSGHANNLGFGMSNFDLRGGPSYDYCFDPSSTSADYHFNISGMWIEGVTTGGACGEGNPLNGWYHSSYPYWVIARDIPTDKTPSCVESTFYMGNLYSGMGYDWINSSGWTGTGTLAPCATGAEQTTASDDLPGENSLLGEASYCILDQWGNMYNLQVNGMYISGTVNHTVCGSCVLIGMVQEGIFSFYVDIPSGAICAEGYVVAALVSSMSGVFQITGGSTGSISFSMCTSSADLQPAAGPGPGER